MPVNVLVFLRKLPVLFVRIDAGNAALDALLDLFEPVRGDVDVMGGVHQDVSPEITRIPLINKSLER